MSTPSQIPAAEEPEHQATRLLSLVKPEPAVLLTKPVAPSAPLFSPASTSEPTDGESEAPEGEEEFEDHDQERFPHLVRLHGAAGELRATFGVEMWKSLVELLDISGFLRDVFGDIATGSKYLVNVTIEWVFKPEGKDAWKMIGMRAAIFVVPGTLLFRAIFVHQRKDLFPLVLFCWALASWITGALVDSKKRKKAKAKAAKKAKKKRKKKQREAAEKATRERDQEEPDDEDGEEPESEPPPVMTREEQREALRAWIVAQILANPKGNNGIHMVDLYPLALRDGVTTPDTDPTTFRKLLEKQWGIEVGQVKIGGKNGDNWTGVKLTSVQRAD